MNCAMSMHWKTAPPAGIGKLKWRLRGWDWCVAPGLDVTSAAEKLLQGRGLPCFGVDSWGVFYLGRPPCLMH